MSDTPEKEGDPSPVSNQASLMAAEPTEEMGVSARAEAINEAQRQMGNNKINRMVGDVPEKVVSRKSEDEKV